MREATQDLELVARVDDALIERSCRVDVSHRVDADGTFTLRLRFREPPELRGHAYLIVRAPEDPEVVYHYDPDRDRVDRRGPLEPTWPIGRTGLRLHDLGFQQPPTLEPVHTGDTEIQVRGDDTPRPVHVLRTPLPEPWGAAERHLYVDTEHRLPLRTEDLDAAGDVLRVIDRRDFRRAEAGAVRAFRATIREPDQARTTHLRVNAILLDVPPWHWDPRRFHER